MKGLVTVFIHKESVTHNTNGNSIHARVLKFAIVSCWLSDDLLYYVFLKMWIVKNSLC